MPVINTCIEPGCSTLCIGLFCVQHDAPTQVEFPRGRPWPPLGVLQAQAARSDVPEPALAGALAPVSPAA